jgi:CO/xanthine dehydrogenase Mo-binding subunit
MGQGAVAASVDPSNSDSGTSRIRAPAAVRAVATAVAPRAPAHDQADQWRRATGTEAYVATIIDVDVNEAEHSVRVSRVYVAGYGLIVNPDGLRNQIEETSFGIIAHSGVRLVRPLACNES